MPRREPRPDLDRPPQPGDFPVWYETKHMSFADLETKAARKAAGLTVLRATVARLAPYYDSGAEESATYAFKSSPTLLEEYGDDTSLVESAARLWLAERGNGLCTPAPPDPAKVHAFKELTWLYGSGPALKLLPEVLRAAGC